MMACLSPSGAAVNSQGWSAAQPLDHETGRDRSPGGATVTTAPLGLRGCGVRFQGLRYAPPLAIDDRPAGADPGPPSSDRPTSPTSSYSLLGTRYSVLRAVRAMP